MQPFVLNRHGRLVFPSNVFPELDFSVIRSRDQLDQVMRRDFGDEDSGRPCSTPRRRSRRSRRPGGVGVPTGAIGSTKNTVNCLNCRTRPLRGVAAARTGAHLSRLRCRCFVPKPKRKNTPPH